MRVGGLVKLWALRRTDGHTIPQHQTLHHDPPFLQLLAQRVEPRRVLLRGVVPRQVQQAQVRCVSGLSGLSSFSSLNGL